MPEWSRSLGVGGDYAVGGCGGDLGGRHLCEGIVTQSGLGTHSDSTC